MQWQRFSMFIVVWYARLFSCFHIVILVYMQQWKWVRCGARKIVLFANLYLGLSENVSICSCVWFNLNSVFMRVSLNGNWKTPRGNIMNRLYCIWILRKFIFINLVFWKDLFARIGLEKSSWKTCSKKEILIEHLSYTYGWMFVTPHVCLSKTNILLSTRI